MTYDQLNKMWKTTTKVLLGEELGEVEEYRNYLTKYLEPITTKKSAISGKDVSVFVPYFCKNARFISNDETEEYNKRLGNVKLDINDMKDIDSILRAVSEELYYCGSIITGNSKEVHKSDGIANSTYVYESSEIYDSKYTAFSNSIRSGEFVFGTNWSADDKFLLKGYETFKVVRCMEVIRTAVSSDCFYVASIDECSNCMFTFNQMAKHNLIGNIEFPRDEHKELKDKLIADIRETLKSKKKIPTIVEIIRDGYDY